MDKTEEYVVLHIPARRRIVYTYPQAKQVFTDRDRCMEEAIKNRVLMTWGDPEIIEMELVEG